MIAYSNEYKVNKVSNSETIKFILNYYLEVIFYNCVIKISSSR